MAKEGALVHRECPSCFERITLGSASLDKKIRCPKCREAIVIRPAAKPAPKGISRPDSSPGNQFEKAASLPIVPPELIPGGAEREERDFPVEPVPKETKTSESATLSGEEQKMLYRLIESIENNPSRTYFVCVKDMGSANGTYRILPNERRALGQLKKLLQQFSETPGTIIQWPAPPVDREEPDSRDHRIASI